MPVFDVANGRVGFACDGYSDVGCTNGAARHWRMAGQERGERGGGRAAGPAARATDAQVAARTAGRVALLLAGIGAATAALSCAVTRAMAALQERQGWEEEDSDEDGFGFDFQDGCDRGGGGRWSSSGQRGRSLKLNLLGDATAQLDGGGDDEEVGCDEVAL